MDGIITKGIAGFYYILTQSGTTYECKARGSFKKKKITPCVGDNVRISLNEDEEGKGMIEEIYERKNFFIRPPISNIDLFIVVMAASNPKPNYEVIDKFLVMAESSNTKIVLCVNKSLSADKADLEKIKDIYGKTYPLIFTEAIEGKGIDKLKEFIKGKRAAFAGPSGVGKSTMLNAINPDANAKTGEISQKLKRGKHTTRHVEIFGLEEGGMIYDTPGFSSFDILEVKEEELDLYYPEIAVFKGECYFDNCRHLKEPGCKVREALSEGKIPEKRYESYVSFIEEIREKKKKY